MQIGNVLSVHCDISADRSFLLTEYNGRHEFQSNVFAGDSRKAEPKCFLEKHCHFMSGSKDRFCMCEDLRLNLK